MDGNGEDNHRGKGSDDSKSSDDGMGKKLNQLANLNVNNDHDTLESSASPLILPALTSSKSSTILPSVTDVDVSANLILDDTSSIALSDEGEVNGEDEDEEALQDVLQGLIDHHNGVSQVNQPLPLNYMNIFKLDYNNTPNFHDNLSDNQSFYHQFIEIGKDIDETQFNQKLKHFFILSSAGKPIYSMNGSDSIIMGYMGIITTIISTFEENLHEQIQSITIGNTKIVCMNKNPIILVAISKIAYEFMGIKPDNILINQLNTLYNYVLSILSKQLIDKNFHNRMNYDLRKILTRFDYKNLDLLCMKLTYGLPIIRNDCKSFDFFISNLLNSSLQSIKISKTIRNKLDKILLNSKKLKDEEEFIGEDLLFALLMSSNKLISFMKPKNHTLVNQDLKILISTIQAQEIENIQIQEDLWFPLCMPNFNPNGFLYVFVKKFELFNNGNPHTVSIILISGNKNSFYQMQQLSSYIIHKIVQNSLIRQKFYQDLINSSKLSITNDLRIKSIKHFVYKLKKYNQFVMSNVSHFNNDTSNNSILQLVYFYSNLHNNQTLSINNTNSSPRKLSYMRWNWEGSNVTGFMLSDENSEFYCICNENITSQMMISYSLKIIKWCERYEQRLFIGNGVVF